LMRRRVEDAPMALGNVFHSDTAWMSVTL